MQYSISQSDNNACDILIEYAGGIKHINDYIHRLSIDSFNLSETEDGHALQLRGCIPQLEYSFRYGPTTENGWWKRVVLQQGAERLLWQTMIDTETGANKLKGMLPAKP